MNRRRDGGGDSPGTKGPILAAGSKHTCALFGEGAVRCWGDNQFGQLGRPTGVDPLADYSVDLGTERRAIGIYAGQYHTCTILEGGAVKCWGDNTFGQLGVGDGLNRGDGTAAMGDGLPLVDLGTNQRAVALALGGTASCALLATGRVKCWGDPYQGATGHGDVEPRGGAPGTMGDDLPAVDLGARDGVPLRVKVLAALEYHSFCAIVEEPDPATSGLKCWGSNDYCELGLGSSDGGRGAEPGSLGDALPWVDLGTTASGAARQATSIAGGFQSVCALGDDGVVKCWGTNRSGELGLGTVGDPRSCSPDEVGNAGLVSLPAAATALAARREHACALLATGQVTCWGVNSFGELGTGDTLPRLAPSEALLFPPGFTPAQLVLGDDHACALTADQRITCWGSNRDGQLGVGATADRSAPGPALRVRGAPVSVVATGGDHTCVLLGGGALKCWGRNDAGQLGLGDTVPRGEHADQMGDALPVVALGRGATAVAAGAAHTCAVLDDGTVTCWGANQAGQLGGGTVPFSPTPSGPVALPAAALALAAGDDFTCGLLGDGRVFCWGGGARGQRGTGASSDSGAPDTAVALPAAARAIAAGSGHACALLANRSLACWGANDGGQLGLGDVTDRARPAVVALGTKRAVAISSRAATTCALLDDHGVKCWGRNDRGQLGLGDDGDRVAPAPGAVPLGTNRRAAAITVGDAFACALLDTWQAKCWGDNRADQLGAFLRGPAYGDEPAETGDFLATAVQGGGRAVKTISAGRAHACAILDTGELRCWGANDHGQLGAGDTERHSLFLAPTGVVDLGGAP